MAYKPSLLETHQAIKKALKAVGGYEKLDSEQNRLFQEATAVLLAAKFAENDSPYSERMLDEADKAVTQFLGSMPPSLDGEDKEDEEGQPPISKFESILIRASDALDRAGQRELSDELDAILRTLTKENA